MPYRPIAAAAAAPATRSSREERARGVQERVACAGLAVFARAVVVAGALGWPVLLTALPGRSALP